MSSHLYGRDYSHIGKSLIQGHLRTKKNTAISIFLCGGKIDDSSFARPRLFRVVKDDKNLSIRMPEGLFDDLLEKKAYDLLGLEEILAHSVDVIVIFPESPGSFAELGAFSGNTALQRKIICVCDERYKRALSFINVGPLKILKSVKRSRVIYCKYESLSEKLAASALAKKIVSHARAIKDENPRPEAGLFFLEDLIIYALFCMQAATRDQIMKLYTATDIGVAADKLDTIYEVCLHTLLTANKIEKNEHGVYELSQRAVHAIIDRSSKERLAMLRAARVETMNSSLRRHAETKSARMQKLLP